MAIFVLIWSKNSRVILRRNLVPTLECLVEVPQANKFFDFFLTQNILFPHFYWPHFAEVMESLLMFLLNVLLDLTDELDVFCRSFAIQNTSASLYSIWTYQIKLSPPHCGY